MSFLYYVFPILAPLNYTPTNVAMNESMVMQYLHEYGYLKDMKANFTEKNSALQDFQYFVDVDPTGNLDNETIEMMGKPRCGRPDRTKTKIKRYTFIGKMPFSESVLNYRITSYLTNISKYDVDGIFSRAFSTWAEHLNIKFTTSRHTEDDINIKFASIDGEGKIYGVTSPPSYRNIILDSDEQWTQRGNDGINLLQVAVHEIGHVLGLGHSDNRNSVMFPYYLSYQENFTLDIDDITGVKVLYKQFPSITFDENGNRSALCNNPTIDAIFAFSDGYVYIFQNKNYWKFSTNFVMVDGPKPITSKWKGLPNLIDTAFTAWNNITYFFKQNLVWKYYGTKQLGKPKLIRYAFENIPNDLDAVFTWSANGHLYFFKGPKYWMFDAFKPPYMRIKYYYPLDISLWQGVPNYIDDAVSVKGTTYFFKGEYYYKYDDRNERVEYGYPRSIRTDIFRCTVLK
ncbi:hypothetical protein FQA39_LY09687 [Lamprigera yunnana]|nr:hypothetical protein FQA39_LY09687 [Lamprigera yunnana]